MKQKRKLYLFAGVVFLMVFGILYSVFMMTENKAYYQKREHYLYLATNQASVIEGCLDTVIARVYTLSAMIQENKGETEFFDDSAKYIFDDVYRDTGVLLKNIALAPNGVVKCVYPKEGNESFIGFHYMDSKKEGNEEAIRSYKKGKLVLTNPFELSQGGVGMAGRLPVYIQKDGKRKFWGLVSVTLDYDLLMEKFNLKDLDNMGICYSIWYTDDAGKKVVLAGSKNKPENPVKYIARPKNLKWHVEISPKEGWYNRMELVFGTILILFVSVIMVYLLLARAKIQSINDQLKVMAHRDNLTGCYSRHYLHDVLINAKTGLWNDESYQYSLIIIDIDKFKHINDTYGHAVGDEAICAVAKMLKSLCHTENGDCVIRFGGDEFIVLYNDVTKELLQEKLEAIVGAARQIKLKETPDIKITLSAGAKHWDSGIKSYHTLFAAADEKLYQAKENGRNQYVL